MRDNVLIFNNFYRQLKMLSRNVALICREILCQLYRSKQLLMKLIQRLHTLPKNSFFIENCWFDSGILNER